MRNLASLSLLILTMLTGIALGAARGQVLVAGTAVLCSGATVRVTPAPGGPQGDKPGHAAFCPDMATGLLIALATPPALAPRPVGTARPLDVVAAAAIVARPAVLPRQARAPPVAGPQPRFNASPLTKAQP